MARFEIDTDLGRFEYETDPCRLTGPDGQPVDLSRFSHRYLDPELVESLAPAFSPVNPITGKQQPRVLKIQLGLGCNYSCSYCSQGGQQAEHTSKSDAHEFLAGLDGWLQEAPEKIEFWGGEPMLYWHKLQILAPALRERFPAARLSIVTNGSLLTLERARWLHELGFTLAVSHDGPGQALRGDDPFNDPAWADMLRQVFELFGDRASMLTVISPANPSPVDAILWFERRMFVGVPVNVEGIMADYGGAHWSGEAIERMSRRLADDVAGGAALAIPRVRSAALDWLNMLARGTRVNELGQVCGMDRQDRLAVDLAGNVVTCQNVGAQSGHAAGSARALGDVALTKAHSWQTRPHCRACPVVNLCRGACMLLEGNEHAATCQASFGFYSAVLLGMVRQLTGAARASLAASQPLVRRVIPIKVTN